MKPGLKWTLMAMLVALLAVGTWRTMTARQTKQATLEAQQQAQKTQVALILAPADLVSVKKVDLPMTLAISGTMKAVNTAFVKARVPGELLGLTVREGDSVTTGQVLAHIDPLESRARLSQARQQAQAAQAQVDIAQRSYDNNRALVNQGFISGTALETSQANLAAAQATRAAAQAGADLAAKSLDDSVLRAPIAGQVSQRLAQTGERVAVDTRVLEIVDVRQLELEATLDAAQAIRVKPGQVAQVQVAGEKQAVNATVVRLNPSANAGSRTVPVYLRLAQNSGLRHGLFAQGVLHVGKTTSLALPLSAVRTDKPEPYLQTVLQNTVRHAPINIGLRGEIEGLTWVAVDGVAAGTQVLAGHVGVLRAGTPVVRASTAPPPVAPGKP